MGQIALQIPQVGAVNSTEDPKIASDFTAVQTVINGGLDTGNLSPSAAIVDTQLASPSNTVRRLLLQQQSVMPQGSFAWTVGGQDFILTGNVPVTSGGLFGPTPTGQTSAALPALWFGDSGINGNPLDFTVAGKSPFCRVRASVLVNNVTPAMNLYAALYPITAVNGPGSATVNISIGAAVTGSATNTIAPAAFNVYGIESGQFAMPITGSAFLLGINVAGGGGVMAASSCVVISAQLFGYSV